MFFNLLNEILSKIIFFTSSIGNKSFPAPLTPDEEKRLLKSFKENGDISAKNELIEHNLRLVAHVAKKYQGSMEQDDLLSIGAIGLIKAINTYSDDKGTQLATYTARCIENEILMQLRSNKKRKNDVSLTDAVGTDKDGNELSLIDLLADDGSVIDEVENKVEREKFRKIVKSCLDKREYAIISLRYGLDGGVGMAQREVAEKLDISRSYVSRIEKKAIVKIQQEVKNRSFFID